MKVRGESSAEERQTRLPASGGAGSEGSSHRAWWWFRLAVIIALVFMAAPWPLSPTSGGLDASWIIGLNAAHARGFVFGRDIVFTYGPLGYLLFPMPGFAGPVPALLMGLLPFAVFAFAVVRLSLVPGVRGGWIYVAVLLVAWFLAGDEQNRPAIACIACLLSTLALANPRVVDIAILGIASALQPGIKVNGVPLFLAGYVAVIGVLAWRQRLRPAKAASLIMLPPIVALIPYMTSGGLKALPELLAGSREIVDGYSEAMGFDGPLWQLQLASAGLLGFLAIAAFVREKRAFAGVFIPAALVAFAAFKGTMVRQDAHATPFHLFLALAVAIAATAVPSFGARRLVLAFALLNACAGLWIAAHFDPPRFARAAGVFGLTAPARYVGWWANFAHSWARLAVSNEAVFERLQLPRDFDAAAGGRTVEAVPYSIDRVIANGWRWAPRPVMQTYSAYTPYLDELNAAHVRSPEAAGVILLLWGTIDKRHMFFEDPASWVETFSNYRVRLTHPDFSLLERRHSPLLGRAVPMGQTVVGWNQETRLPATRDLLVMHADIRYSLTGELRRALLRSTPVFVAVTKASGAHASWRAVQSNLRDGAIVNYLPESTEELALLAGERRLLPEPVVSIHFETARPSDYAGVIKISWERRPIRTAASNPVEVKEQLWSPASELPRGVDTRIDRTPDGIRVNTWSNDPQLYFSFRRDLRSFGRIAIRARFQKRDYIDLFFGRQVSGRGMDAMAPVAGAWLDVVFDVAMNPFWQSEAGTAIRFDPSSGVGVNAVDIAGIWGVDGPAPDDASPVEFRPVTDEQLSTERRTGKR